MSYYERLDKLDIWKNRIIYCSTFITLVLNLNERYNFLASYGFDKIASNYVIALNTVLVFSYVVLEIIASITFQKAEGERIIRFIDNSFDQNFSGVPIPQTGFFTQDNLHPGLYKMCVNCFESSLFTLKIAGEMINSKYIMASVIILIFVSSASIGDSGTVRYLTDAILPLAIFQEAIKFNIYCSRLESNYQNFTAFFNTINGNMTEFSRRDSEALKLIITYETTLAWSSIKLDSKVYNKLNHSLTTDWNQLKQQYNI